jgi:hypothetical protein
MIDKHDIFISIDDDHVATIRVEIKQQFIEEIGTAENLSKRLNEYVEKIIQKNYSENILQ